MNEATRRTHVRIVQFTSDIVVLMIMAFLAKACSAWLLIRLLRVA